MCRLGVFAVQCRPEGMSELHAHGRTGHPVLQGLPADIRACQPTVFCSVPKIFERFESAARDKVGPWA